MLFLIGAMRAVIELIGLVMLGQGALYLLTGGATDRNPIYRLFFLLTAPPRHLVRNLLPSSIPDGIIPGVTFSLLLFLWLVLAWVRSFV